jgi:hypothetical protein
MEKSLTFSAFPARVEKYFPSIQTEGKFSLTNTKEDSTL